MPGSLQFDVLHFVISRGFLSLFLPTASLRLPGLLFSLGKGFHLFLLLSLPDPVLQLRDLLQVDLRGTAVVSKLKEKHDQKQRRS